MVLDDFRRYSIRNFSPKEITDTGADLEKVQLQTICTLQSLRERLDTKINLLKNGLTSGKHSSELHPGGKAVDVFIPWAKSKNEYPLVMIEAWKVGFNGVGVYFNEETELYTFHFDLGEKRAWIGTKETRSEPWIYKPFFRGLT